MGGEQIPEVVLSSGHKMPLIGMGTVATPLPPTDQLTSILVDAVENGYRHFDTAAIYGSEESLGKAIAQALERGLIKNRDEMFITSKLWCTDAEPHLVLPALKNTLKNLGLEYLDLYLIHWPIRMKQGKCQTLYDGKNLTMEDILDFDIKGTWEAMEECFKLGLAKSIGVSNYNTKKLSQLLQDAIIPPAVIQVEMNPAWQRQQLREFCKEKGIHVSAWSPLGGKSTLWGSSAVMDSPVLRDIAAAKGKSLAQVALRWIYEQGASAIVKSFNKERMKQNCQIFDWELSEDELSMIKQILQHSALSGNVIWDISANR